MPLGEFYNPESVNNITRKEIQVLKLMVQGFSHEEIRKILGVSLQTVKNHVSQSLDKTPFNNTLQLILALIDTAVIDPYKLIPDLDEKIKRIDLLAPREKVLAEQIADLGDTTFRAIAESKQRVGTTMRVADHYASGFLGVRGKLQFGIVMFAAYQKEGVGTFVPGIRRHMPMNADFSI